MWIVWTAMAVAALCFTLYVAIGGKRLRRQDTTPFPRTIQWPRATVIIPVKSIHAVMEEALLSLLRQDYPDFEVIFVTESKQDQAVGVIKALLRRFSGTGKGKEKRQPTKLKHVVSGTSHNCGQKNHNLLAGVRNARRASTVYVFCDSSHLAPSDWLRHLLAPIALGNKHVTTGYHYCTPQENGFHAWGKTMNVLAMNLLQEIPFVTQPWGGNMAIRRTTFEEMGIAECWANNVVDDVSLAACLERNSVKAAPVIGARMETRLSKISFREWKVWLKRQLIYLKFIFPGTWIALGLALYGMTALILGSVAIIVSTFFCSVPFLHTVLAGVFLLVLALLGLYMRAHYEKPPHSGSWLLVFFSTFFVSARAHLATMFQWNIVWHDIVYSVGFGGRVKKITRPDR